MRPYLLLASLVILSLASCKAISEKTPVCYRKPPHAYHNAQSAQAAQYFWTVFQSADYARSDQALAALTAATAADPTDPHMVSLTGLCSFWKVVEHNRGCIPSAATQGLAVQSLQYVQQAACMDPSNRLTPGFVSSAKYQLGAMQGNRPMMEQAASELERNTNIFPQFHGFVEGWVLTAMLPPDHPRYEAAVEAYYETLDSCAGIRVPRSFPRLGEFGFYILAKKSKNQTVCYNTDIAPHNVEGTLLGLGDALVKQGKHRQARMVYQSITRIPAYKTWPYKEVLNYRLNNMEQLTAKWICDSGQVDVQEPAMLFQSSISCTSCHAK